MDGYLSLLTLFLNCYSLVSVAPFFPVLHNSKKKNPILRDHKSECAENRKSKSLLTCWREFYDR